MWGKLLLLSVLACRVVYPVLSTIRDGDVTNTTKMTFGSSGAVCTKQGRKCIDTALCKNKRCRCPPGMKGNGQIECVKKGEHLCSVVGDPHTVAYGGAKTTVSIPCAFPASRFVTKNYGTVSGHGYCSFEIHVTNELKMGRYVARTVKIACALGDYAAQMHTSFHIYKSTNYQVNDTDMYQYIASVSARDSIWGSSKNNLQGLDVKTTFDVVNNFAILEIPQCGTRIKYRAMNPYTPKHQKQLHGVTIQAPDHADFVSGYGNYPFQICGTPDDTHSLYKERAAYLGLLNGEVAVVYDILKLAPEQGEHEKAAECKEAFDIFNTSSNKISDLNACAFLLTKKALGRCIEESRRHPFNLFLCCMKMQQGNAAGCACTTAPAKRCDGMVDWNSAAPNELAIGCSVSL